MDSVTILQLIAIFLQVRYLNAIERHYYVAVEEIEWDYAPEGNLLRDEDSDSYIYLQNDPSVPLIGTKYIKAVYREYTDDKFKRRKKHPEWMGIIGVFFKAEIGDQLIVHFYNKAKQHNFTMHPHGVFYNKNTEGAMYLDETSGRDKLDDAVQPGQKHTYVWLVHPDYGPVSGDPNCISWLVHSHQFAEPEVMTGAVAMMATCRKGTLDDLGNRKDVDREYALLFMIFDENFSLYWDQNNAKYIPDRQPNSIAENFTIFQESNRKYSINGYIYGNLNGLEAKEGETISFHIAVVGNDPDLHTIYIQGHNMIVYHHRKDTLEMFPGDSLTAITKATNPGRWLLSSQSVLHIRAGMQAFFDVKPSKYKKSSKESGQTLNYYIAAEEVWWDYAPTKKDLVTGTPLSEHRLASASFGDSTDSNCKLNGVYKKAIYRGYTSRYFDTPINNTEDLGFLGPPIKAEVGDTVKVMFYNKATKNFSIQAYRFFAEEDENGIQFDEGADVVVEPNEKRVYTWRVPESVEPTRDDPDCLYGRYYSAIDIVKDAYSGLTGPVVICRKGKLHGKQNLDKEFYLSFAKVNEFESHYIEESVNKACPGQFQSLLNNNDFRTANVMNSLNGRVYGNLEGLTMCKGDRVNWYLTAVGNGIDDMHTPHFHGNTFDVSGSRKDTFPLIPDVFVTAYMVPDNVGVWSLEDQVVLHFLRATTMEFLYEVKDCEKEKKSTEESNQEINLRTYRPDVRTYYIAAVEKEWNYAPMDLHLITGEKISENEDSRKYYETDPNEDRIGHKFIKAMYREFTDKTFKTEKKRTPQEVHLGLLGPFIKAEVGEVLRVVFMNKASFNYSIMPHGLLYNKSNEGYPYQDGIPLEAKPGDMVAPGATYTYEWLVPERAGPGPDNFNCITWAYISHVDYAIDINDGLIGPLVICRRGILDRKGRRLDVDKEWGLLFFITSEGESHYIEKNVETYLHKDRKDITFKTVENNFKLHINGYSFGNVPNVTMYQGETAAVNIISLGGQSGTHTVHFHGNTFIRRLSGIHRHDVMDVLPGNFEMVELTGINKGNWLVHCHVNNHSEVGMEMVYHVVDPDDIYNPLPVQ